MRPSIPWRAFRMRGAWTVVAVALVFSMPNVGMTQTQNQPPPTATPSPDQLPAAEFAPRGQRMARTITYSAWRKLCFRLPDATVLCRTTISGAWDTGQVAVRVALVEREGGGGARLQLFLPVGLYLQAGVKLTADQGKPVQIPYVWCLTNTCIAADLANLDFIREMEAGQKLILEVVDSNVLTVATTLPLEQFSAVRRAAPSQIFEREPDNE